MRRGRHESDRIEEEIEGRVEHIVEEGDTKEEGRFEEEESVVQSLVENVVADEEKEDVGRQGRCVVAKEEDAGEEREEEEDEADVGKSAVECLPPSNIKSTMLQRVSIRDPSFVFCVLLILCF